MRHFPSTRALRAFSSAARLGGVRAAAVELGVTQSAISHQINLLEGLLGTPLFIRNGRGVVLSEAGRDYLEHVGAAMRQLEQATTQAARRRSRPPLTVSAPSTFIFSWLLPYLGEFEALYPGQPLRLLQHLTFDPGDRSIDVSVEYRFQPNPAGDCTMILSDGISILAAPAYARDNNLRSIGDLSRARLIETDRRLVSWLDVLADKPWVRTHPFLSVPHSLHAVEAARLGYGVAIGNTLNARRLLNEGSLVIPFELEMKRYPEIPRYFVTVPSEKRGLERVKRFRDWLIGKARSFEGNAPLRS